MKKLLSLLLSTVMLVAVVVGCSKKNEVNKIDPNKKEYSVAILQVSTHTALDAARNGFKDKLNEWARSKGKTIKYDEENALGNAATETTMADKIVSAQPDLALGISTSSARALAGSTTKIPVLFTAVTDVKNELKGRNVTGTSDMVPIAKQIDLINAIAENCKKIALVYHTSEENSQKQVEIAKNRCKELGITAVEYGVENTNLIATTAQAIRSIGDIDAVYVPTDNMLAANMPALCDELYGDSKSTKKIPVIAGESGMCESGEALATLGLDYYKLGEQTADIAIRILEGETPSKIPFEYYKLECDVYVNETNAAKLGYTEQKIADIKNFGKN